MDGLNSCIDIDGGSDQLTLKSVTVHSVDSDECHLHMYKSGNIRCVQGISYTL